MITRIALPRFIRCIATIYSANFMHITMTFLTNSSHCILFLLLCYFVIVCSLNFVVHSRTSISMSLLYRAVAKHSILGLQEYAAV